MKKAYVVVIVLIAAALLVAGILWMRQDDKENGGSNTTAPEQNSSENSENEQEESTDGQTVTYDGAGFSPASLTVSAGDTVTFRNDSATEVWPASAVHPTHNELPGFDALEGLGQGEEYSFTFEEAGEWAYHNHLEPSQTGVIVVE